jgi:hypothetical protein
MHHSRTILSALLLSSSAVLLALPDRSNTDPVHSAYLGFDLNEYPGDGGLAILRKTFSFAGYWLSPPPGDKQTGWLGKRALLQSQGFGFVVLFNGRVTRNLKSPSDAHQKGALDGQNAAKLARQEGFPSGTIIFLDIEEGGRLSDNYHDYVNAWIDTLAQANFRAGAYCSGVPLLEDAGHAITSAEDLQDHLAGRKLALWVFNDVCPPSPGCVFPQTPPAVMHSGVPGAAIWQYAQSPRRKERTSQCVVTYAPDGNCYAPGDTAHKWLLDANVATLPDPSAALE